MKWSRIGTIQPTNRDRDYTPLSRAWSIHLSCHSRWSKKIPSRHGLLGIPDRRGTPPTTTTTRKAERQPTIGLSRWRMWNGDTRLPNWNFSQSYGPSSRCQRCALLHRRDALYNTHWLQPAVAADENRRPDRRTNALDTSPFSLRLLDYPLTRTQTPGARLVFRLQCDDEPDFPSSDEIPVF